MGGAIDHGTLGVLEAICFPDAHLDVGPRAVPLKRAICRGQNERVASGQAFEAEHDTRYRESRGPCRLDNDATSFRRQSSWWEVCSLS